MEKINDLNFLNVFGHFLIPNFLFLILYSRRDYTLNNNSHGFSPVCFLKAVEKCEIEE
jgi:hypothetical protein